MNQYIIPNLSKTCEILKLLARNQNGMTAREIEIATETPKTTTFRILKTLCNSEMAIKRDNHFFAGPSLYEIGLAALRDYKLREIAIPIMQQLTGETRLTSHLVIPSRNHSLILEVCDSPGPIRVASRPGTQTFMHSSAHGKIFLAYLHSDHLEEKMAELETPELTANTITTVEKMREETELIKARGYSVDNQEYHMGVQCMSAPVFNLDGIVIAAVGVTAPSEQISLQDETLINSVKNAAQKLSEKIGHKD